MSPAPRQDSKWTTITNKFATMDSPNKDSPNRYPGDRSQSLKQNDTMNLSMVAGGMIQTLPALDRPDRQRRSDFIPLDLQETYSSFQPNQPMFARSTGFVDMNA